MAKPTFPPVEVPAFPLSAYDAGYFSGKTSNYLQGYTWETFGELFTHLAYDLTRIFTRARTWLDVGCATGLLVRALRTEGVEAWGVDGSTWAIAHADPMAKPYVQCQPLEALALNQTSDVVVAMETLEHLSLVQLAEALPRLRQHTGLALVATIPTPDMAGQRAWELARTEPSHVTLHPRTWWQQQFRKAGFVYGPWQHLVEHLMGRMALFQAMEWNVFIQSV